MKFLYSLMSLTAIGAAVGGSVFYGMKGKDDAGNGQGQGTEIKYFLVEKMSTEPDVVVTTEQNADTNSKDYQCAWENDNNPDKDCQFAKISIDQTKKVINMSNLKNQSNAEIKKIADFSTEDTNNSKQYYILKSTHSDVKTVSVSNISGNKTPKITFLIRGQFTSEWKFIGASNLVVAKVGNISEDSVLSSDLRDGAGIYSCQLSNSDIPITDNTCWVSSSFTKSNENFDLSNITFPDAPDKKWVTLTSGVSNYHILHLDAMGSLNNENAIGKEIIFEQVKQGSSDNKSTKATFTIEHLVINNVSKSDSETIILN